MWSVSLTEFNCLFLNMLMISFSFDVLMQTDVFCDCVQMNSAFHRQLLAGVQWRFLDEIDFSADFRLSSSFFFFKLGSKQNLALSIKSLLHQRQ